MFKLMLDLFSRFYEDDVPALGSQLAFNLLLSFFPFLIFLMTLIGQTPLNEMELLMTLSKILPDSVFDMIKNAVREVINTKNNSLMSFSFIITLWSASGGFNAAIKGLNNAYGIKESRSFIRVRIVSMLCTIGMAFLIILIGLLLVFGKLIWNTAASKFIFLNNLLTFWSIARYSIVISANIGVFVLLYRFAPSRKQTWMEVVPGALFSTASLMFASTFFAYYVNNFANYSVVYGSLGAIVVSLTWLFLASIILIMGGEVNASLAAEEMTYAQGKIKNIK